MSAHQPYLFGRQREQQILQSHLSALRRGEGAVVLIGGDAGVGKSALVDDVLRAAQAAGATILTGSCYDLTATPPYGPWLDLARRYQPRPPDDPPPTSLTGAGVIAVGSQAALFDDAGRFLSALAGRNSLVIALEDMHWSDPASIDLLRVIARQAATIPALLLVTYRATELSREGPLYALLPLIVREARATRIDLQPLDRAAIDALVSARYALVSADHARLTNYLERHAEGNPFYIEEVLRGLENEQALTRVDDGWQLGTIDRMRTPELLRQIVNARLSTLQAVTRDRLVTGAVIGQDVPLELWRAVLDVSDDALLDTIEQAVSEQIIEAAPDGLTARFRHALIRSALYESILPPRRRIMHRAIADALIASGSSDPDAVVWHLQQAHDERAAGWLIRAAERAQRAYAWTTAAERLIAAVELLPATAEARDRGWLHYRIGRLRRHADSANAIHWLHEAERLGSVSADPVLTAYARFDLGHIQVLTGDFQRGLDRMLAAGRLLESLPPDHAPPGSEIAAWVADALPSDVAVRSTHTPAADGIVGNITRHGTLCQWLVEPGRLAEARALAEPFVAAIDRLPVLDEQALSSAGDAWFGLGRVAAAQAAPDTARDALSRAIECYRRINHHLLIAGTMRVELTEVVIPYETTSIAERRRLAATSEEAYRQAIGALPPDLPPRFASLELMLLEGDWDEAAELLEPMTAQSSAMVTWRHRATALLGRLACDRGDFERASDCVHMLLPAGPQTQAGTTTFNRAIELHLVALDLALATGEMHSARSWLESLDRWLEWSGAQRWQPERSLGWAKYHLLAGDTSDARCHARTALQSATDPRQPLGLLSAHRTLGRIETIDGQYAAADVHVAESLAFADACVAPFERALTVVALAELRIASGDITTAHNLLDDACDALERLGASPALERAHSLLASVENAGKPPAAAFGLSKRELEVLRLVTQGMTDAEVAEQLFISYRTVTTHLTSIFNKLGVSSRVSATRIAIENDLV